MSTESVAVARSVAALREAVAGWRVRQETIGLVPTMGALHRGHLALVEAVHRQCRRVVASLFVNPKQFGPREDFAAYPRDEAADLAKFREAGISSSRRPSRKCTPRALPPAFRSRGSARPWKARTGPAISTVSRRSSPSCCCNACRMQRFSAKRITSSSLSCAAWRTISTVF